jgi:hypothetical protein
MPWTDLPHRGTAYLQLAIDTSRRLARFRRSDLALKPENGAAVLEQFVEDINRLLPVSERRKYRLLTDTREAPRISSPELEAKLLSIMSPIMMHFACVAVLLRTPIGVLQMRRLLRTWPIRAEVFEDESEAILWLLRQEPAGPDSAAK